eukprot:TRINITY_DN325_c0_g1_i1.p1 TRINITY_DN325_c0_g1~~TRINITY_DN325_c0_g1_i1.p1  ORF type:complete len:341 (-),score=102.91 TRINITY_DN325_c0_g1_i1:79-1101(-)
MMNSFKKSFKNKNLEKNITKKLFHNNSIKKNIFNKFKDANQKYFKLIGKRRNSSLTVSLDKIANNIPKSSLLFVGAASGLGLAALVAYGASQETKTYTQTQAVDMYGIPVAQEQKSTKKYSSELRQKLFNAYGYFAASLGLTGVATVLMAKSPLVYRMHQNPWAFFGVGVAGSIAAMIATYSIDYHKNPTLKHLSWASLIALEGFALAPMTVLGGPLIMNALVGTTCIVGSISLLAAVSPSDAWRQWSGVYGVGLGVLMGSSIGLAFFPRSNILYNVFLYLGLAVHGWGVYRSNGRIIDHANRVPMHIFDPINESISLYLHTISIFVRVVMMLMNQKRKN